MFKTLTLQTSITRAATQQRSVSVRAANRPLWFPGAAPPSYLDGSVAGDRGFDPIGLGAEPRAMAWYRAAELVHARWAMLGVAGILAQEITHPEQWWYTSGLPENLPAIEVGGKMNIGGLLAWEFLLMHWVEVRRWQVRAIFVMLVVVASALRRSVGPGSLLLPSPVSDALLPILTDDNCPNNHTNRTSRSREV